MSKEKIYKNPERGNDKPPTPYKPQWKVLGREPVRAGEPSAPANPQFKAQVMSPKNIGNNVPFAEILNPRFENGKLPNVGNNVENTWAGIDSISMEDDQVIEIKENDLMIDNNDFVEIPQNNNQVLNRINRMGQLLNQSQDIKSQSNNLEEALTSLQDDDYILFVKGNPYAVGPLNAIQEEVRKLVFEDHLDDLVVLKNVQIKIGVFLE